MADIQEAMNTVKEKAGAVYEKLDNAKDIAKLSLQVKQSNMEMNKLYKKIGEIAYKKQIAIDSDVNELYASVDDLRAQVIAYKTKITELRKEKRCPGCGKNLPRSFTYCPACGAKQEREEESAEKAILSAIPGKENA